MILLHGILIKVFLVFLIAGLAIPFMTAKNPLGFKKYSFYYTMAYQAILTLIAITGIIALIMDKTWFTLDVILMIIVWAILMYIEITKHKQIKLANLEDEQIHNTLKNKFLKISILQIALVVGMVVIKIIGI